MIVRATSHGDRRQLQTVVASPGRTALYAAALCLIAVACGVSGDGNASAVAEVRPDADVRVEAAETTEAHADPSEVDDAASSGLAGSATSTPEDPVEEIPFRIRKPNPPKPTTTQSPTTTAASSSSQTSGTTSSGTNQSSAGQASSQSVSPVTTIAGPGGEVASLYKGFLGTLGRNEQVVAPLGVQPATTAGVQPLTGLAGPVPDRPAAIVKVDNSSPARPQSGLNAADIVVEEEVEGGVTRFAAIFHSSSTTVGPVRSARTTDIGIVNSFGSPLLMYSGANTVTEGLVRAQTTVQNRNAGTSSGYWRNSGRRAPSNLYTDTAGHWASATSGPPPAQFSYRQPGQGVSASAPNATPASSFTVAYRASAAGWSWDGSMWLRTQGGRRHMTAAGDQVSAHNVVVVEVREVPTGMVDSTGANVPEFVFVGAGNVTVFTDGKRIQGRWNKPALALAPTLMSGGSEIKLTPGRTWIQLVSQDKGLLR